MLGRKDQASLNYSHGMYYVVKNTVIKELL